MCQFPRLIHIFTIFLNKFCKFLTFFLKFFLFFELCISTLNPELLAKSRWTSYKRWSVWTRFWIKNDCVHTNFAPFLTNFDHFWTLLIHFGPILVHFWVPMTSDGSFWLIFGSLLNFSGAHGITTSEKKWIFLGSKKGCLFRPVNQKMWCFSHTQNVVTQFLTHFWPIFHNFLSYTR